MKKELPSGVAAVLHGTKHADNLFHRSYFWEFEHTPEGLASLLSQLGAGSKYEDFEQAKEALNKTKFSGGSAAFWKFFM